MPSFDTVNYSLRPNKTIQRQIVFDGLEQIDRFIPLGTAAYIGFGSIWFTDFALAHRRLGIKDMISIENKPIGVARAQFNRPFKTVQIEQGHSNIVLPKLAVRADLTNRQWIVWLDYDGTLDKEVLDDARTIITNAPENSVFLMTLNVRPNTFGGEAKREAFIRGLLGDAVGDDLAADAFKDENVASTVAQALSDYLVSEAINLGRPGGYEPAFLIPYKDSAPMLTIGGVLPAVGARPAARACLASATWPGNPAVSVEAPPLTLREIAALQRLLPSKRPVSRSALKKLGFDLEDEQLKAFCAHYQRYPAFVQMVT